MTLLRILCLSTKLFAFPLLSSAFTVNGLNYTINSDAAVLTGATDVSIGRLVVPASVTFSGKVYPVTTIAGQAFWNYPNLHELVIEDATDVLLTDWYRNENGVNVQGDPFKGCPIERIYIGRDLWKLWPAGNYEYNICPVNTTASDVDLTIAGEATMIPKGITDRTFIDKTNITSLTIGGKVTTVHDDAFKGCVNLKSITTLYGEADLSFSATAFTGCENIDRLTISRSWSSSPLPALGHIENITITKDCKKLDYLVFSAPANGATVESIVIEDAADELAVSLNTFRFQYKPTVNHIYCGRAIKDNASLFNGSQTGCIKCNVVSFGPFIRVITSNLVNSAYINRQESPLKVNILGDAERIDNDAFANWARLSDIVLPSSLKSIGKNAFYGCKALSHISFPEGLEQIESTAFEYSALEELSLPASLEYVGEDAFDYINTLNKVVIADSETPLESPALFNSVETVDSVYVGRQIVATQNNAFGLNCKVNHLTLGGCIEVVPSDVLYGETNLQTLTVIGKVSKISDNAFDYCKSMTQLSLPASLTEIGANAFRYCEKLESVTVGAVNPPEIGSLNTFNYSHNATVTVPKGSRHAYRNHKYWKLFKNIKAVGDGYAISAAYDAGMGRVLINGNEASPALTIEEDEPATIAVIPSDGFEIGVVLLDGDDITARLTDAGTYDIPFVIQDHHVEASFVKDASSVESIAGDGDVICINGTAIRVGHCVDSDTAVSLVDLYGNMLYHGCDKNISTSFRGVALLKCCGHVYKVLIR